MDNDEGASASAGASGCVGPRSTGELRAQILKGYDKFTRPGEAKALEELVQQEQLSSSNSSSTVHDVIPRGRAPPEVARIQLHVLSLKGLDQLNGEFRITAWYRRKWNDYRLAYQTYNNSLEDESQSNCWPAADEVPLGYNEDLLELIWSPDFYIDNVAETPHKTGGALYLDADGTIIWSSQVEITLSCHMDFSRFPFDTQQCFFRQSTYRDDAKRIRLDFLEDRKPVTLSTDYAASATLAVHGNSPEWEILDAIPVATTAHDGALDVWPYAEIEFLLKRNSQYYVSFVVAPTLMFVVITWAGFFISRGSAPARVTMAIIAFLANINFLASQLGQLPRLGQNVWLLQFLTMSTYFSFYGIVEYCLCNYLRRIEARLEGARKKIQEARKKQQQQQQDSEDGVGGDVPTEALDLDLSRLADETDWVESSLELRSLFISHSPQPKNIVNAEGEEEEEDTELKKTHHHHAAAAPRYYHHDVPSNFKKDLVLMGFEYKTDLLLLNPKTGRMYLRDEHVDIFSRWVYPFVYVVAFCVVWFTK